MVAMFSTQLFSSNRTGGTLVLVLGWLGIQLSPTELAIAHFTIRKSAHFIAYAVLGAVWFRALRGPAPVVPWKARWAAVALAVCLVTASADEVNQLFTPGRGGSWHDVILDMAGAVFAQLLILTVNVGRRPR